MIVAGRRVLPGAEPFSFPGGPGIGAVLVHGFTGSPFEMRPVGEALATAGIGSEGVLLRGHGTHPDEMVGVPYADWISDVEAGLNRVLGRCQRAVIVGLSMGGTLALNVGARHAGDDRIGGLVTIGAPLVLDDWRLPFAGPLSRVIKWQAWGRPDIKNQAAWDGHVAYRRIRTRAIPELLGLMRDTSERLSAVRQPLRIVQAQSDHVVPPRNAELIRAGVRSTDVSVTMLDNCYHVSTVDHEADALNSLILRFVQGLSATSSTRTATTRNDALQSS
jgi:carboxylesterase